MFWGLLKTCEQAGPASSHKCSGGMALILPYYFGTMLPGWNVLVGGQLGGRRFPFTDPWFRWRVAETGWLFADLEQNRDLGQGLGDCLASLHFPCAVDAACTQKPTQQR